MSKLRWKVVGKAFFYGMFGWILLGNQLIALIGHENASNLLIGFMVIYTAFGWGHFTPKEKKLATWEDELNKKVKEIENKEKNLEQKEKHLHIKADELYERETIIREKEEKERIKKERQKERNKLNKKMREYILERDNYTCQICGISKHDEPHLSLHVDHIIPIAEGGKTVEPNLQCLCWECNLKKGKKIGG